MSGKSFTNELQRALARPDAEKLIRQIDAYGAYATSGYGEWPDHLSDDFDEIISCGCIDPDPDKALAYLAIAVDRIDSAGFLNLMACGVLEDLLGTSSSKIIERVVAEARKSARFRWMLSSPYKVAVSEQAWQAIEPFRITGPHEEPTPETIPPRNPV